MGRRAYAPPNAPDDARAISPRVYVRWLPAALVQLPRAPTLQPDQHGRHTQNSGELWKELAAPKQRKQPHVRHRHPHLGYD